MLLLCLILAVAPSALSHYLTAPTYYQFGKTQEQGTAVNRNSIGVVHGQIQNGNSNEYLINRGLPQPNVQFTVAQGSQTHLKCQLCRLCCTARVPMTATTVLNPAIPSGQFNNGMNYGVTNNGVFVSANQGLAVSTSQGGITGSVYGGNQAAVQVVNGQIYGGSQGPVDRQSQYVAPPATTVPSYNTAPTTQFTPTVQTYVTPAAPCQTTTTTASYSSTTTAPCTTNPPAPIYVTPPPTTTTKLAPVYPTAPIIDSYVTPPSYPVTPYEDTYKVTVFPTTTVVPPTPSKCCFVQIHEVQATVSCGIIGKQCCTNPNGACGNTRNVTLSVPRTVYGIPIGKIPCDEAVRLGIIRESDIAGVCTSYTPYGPVVPDYKSPTLYPTTDAVTVSPAVFGDYVTPKATSSAFTTFSLMTTILTFVLAFYVCF